MAELKFPTDPFDPPRRPCPACGEMLYKKRLDAEERSTVEWRCDCGFAYRYEPVVIGNPLMIGPITPSWILVCARERTVAVA